MLSLERSPEGVGFWIHVTPRSRRTGIGGTHGDALRVQVTAPPVEGAANEACRRVLAEALGVRRSDVALDAGSRGRRKRVRVTGEPEALARCLHELAGEGASR